MKLATFITRHRIKIENERIDKRTGGTASEWDASARHWRVMLYCGGRRLVLEFSQGSAHKKEPTTANVLSCLLSDASGIMNSRNFAEWVSACGYDEDSRKTEALWKECKRQTAKLREFLGEDDFQFLLDEVEAE